MRRVYGLLVDLFLIALATGLAMVLRDNLEVSYEHLSLVIPYTLFSLGAATVALPVFGAERVLWRFSTLEDYLRIIAATVIIVATACVCSFTLNRLEAIPRAMPILQGLLVALALIGARVAARLQHSAPAVGNVPVDAQPRMPTVSGPEKNVLIVGLTRLTDLYIRSAAEFAPNAIRIAGLLGQKERYTGSSVHQYTVLGVPEDVADIVRKLEVHGVFVDCIVIAKRFETLTPKAQQALLQLEASTSIRLEFLTESLGFASTKRGEDPGESTEYPDQATTQELSAFAYSPGEIKALYARPYWRIKRAVDFVVAATLLLLAAPFMVAIAILVSADVGWPVSFWQQRPGRGGRPIHLYKFRTMGSAHDSKGHRIPDDRRLSLIGRFLRRSRLDELPQLFSILSGDMSFVGPRPLLPVDQPPEYAARLLVPPGLTGWAQVNGGREVSAADKAALDVWYVQNASPLLDMRIVVRTVPMILFGERVSRRDIQRAWRELQAAGICKYPGVDKTAVALSSKHAA